jgi:cytochrome c oxidase assembly factor CtaG
VLILFEALLPVVLMLAYAKRVSTLRRLGREPTGWRQASFAAGMILIALTQVTPLGELSTELVWAHMLAHTLITDQAALLLALGLTGPVLAPIVSAPGIRRLVFIFSPGWALLLWIGLIGLWHTPALYQAAADNAFLHFLEHASFLGAGLAVWLTVFGPFPEPKWFNAGARVGFVVVVHLFGMALANAMMFSGTPFYPDYAASALERGLNPLTDQGTAGAILMAQGFVVMLGVLTWELLKWARQDSERQDLVEFAEAHGVELDDERAARAAKAGRAGALRARIEADAKAREST